VHAHVLSVGTRLSPNAEGRLVPHTLAIVQILEVLSGTPPGTQLVIVELGGEIQGRGMRIAGTPEYRHGEEIVAFLQLFSLAGKN